MSRHRCRLIRNAFHQIAVRTDAVNMMVNHGKAFFIKFRRQMRLRHRHPDTVRKTLAQAVRS